MPQLISFLYLICLPSFFVGYFQNLSQLASINYDLIGKTTKESVEAANPSVP